MAGVGNVLRSDDAFGVMVADRLSALDLPEGVKVVETGVGGIALVQEIMEGVDAVIILDAVDRERPPGTIMFIEPEVVDVESLTWEERHDLLADMHLATPSRALMLAKALGVLPPRVLIIGCQPEDAETYAQGVSEPVAAAIDVAVAEVLRHVDVLCAAPLGGG